MPLDCSGSPQQSCLGTSTPKPLCSRTATAISPTPRLVVVRRRSRGSRRPASSPPAARWRLRAQPWNVRPGELRHRARRRWMPSDLLDRARRNGRLRSVQFAIGAAGVPSRPTTRRARDQLLAQRDALALAQRALRLRVDLRDVDALRADLGADAAARAVVDRGVGRPARRRCGSARPAGRRTSARGTAASRSRTGTRSRRSCTSRSGPASRASRSNRTSVIGSSSMISSAAAVPARQADAVARLLLPGLAPASVAPATSTFSSTRAPVAVDRAQAVVDRDAGPGERLLAEVVGAEARLARRRARRAPAGRARSRARASASRARCPPLATPPVASTIQRAR